MKRIFVLVVGVLATIGFGAAVASADYGTANPSVTVSSSSPAPGASVTVGFGSFCPGDTINITVGSTVVGTVVADGQGNASFVISAPTAVGTYAVSGTGTTCPSLTASAFITVLAPVGALPATGSSSTSAGLGLGVLAVAAGVCMIGVAGIRRRRTAIA